MIDLKARSGTPRGFQTNKGESKPSVGAFGDLRSVPNYEVSLNLLSVLLEISGVFLIMR